MVARLLPTADFAIDAPADQPLRQRRAEQDVIEPQPGVSAPGIPQVIPECIDGLVGVQRADGVEPALADQIVEGAANLGEEECVPAPTLSL